MCQYTGSAPQLQKWYIDDVVGTAELDDYINFVSNSRVKLSSDCFSEWGAVPSGMPQGTKLGPWLFILMINDLYPPGSEAWKYVDDTTLAEVIPRGGQSEMQIAVNAVEQWSSINKLQLNPDKCKELIIDFKKAKHQFDAVTVNSIDLERVDSVKVLGVTITSTLQWYCHISDVIKKANKRMYFLILLKHANVPAHDIMFLSYLYKARSRILCPSVPSRTA